jgi:outer membrane protein TolC
MEAVKLERAARILELQTTQKAEKARLEFLQNTSLPAAAEVYEAARQQWKSGNAPMQDLLQHRKALMQISEEILLARHRLSLSGIRLHHLTSGKWN